MNVYSMFKQPHSFYISGSYFIGSFFHLTVKEKLLLPDFYMLWLSMYTPSLNSLISFQVPGSLEVSII